MNDFGYPHRGDGMFFEHHGGPGVLPWTIFALQLLLLLGLGALLASMLAGRFGRHRPAPAGGPPPRPDALEVVRMRYARGEIDRDRYLEATHDLGGTPVEESQPPPSDAT